MEDYSHGIPLDEFERRMQAVSDFYAPADKVRYQIILHQDGKVENKGGGYDIDDVEKILSSIQAKFKNKNCVVKVAYEKGNVDFGTYKQYCKDAVPPWKERA